MKKIWQKTPAWIRAILLTILLMFPITIFNQRVIVTNTLNLFPAYSFVGLLLVMATLFLYWKLVTKWNPFSAQDDIKINVNSKTFGISGIASIVGLCLLTVSCFALSNVLFPVDTSDTKVQHFLNAVMSQPAITAIPILLAIALNAGVVEEITFRGFVQNTTNRQYARIISYVLIGAIFFFLHFFPLRLLIAFIIISAGFSIVADRFKSVGAVMIAHFLADVFLLMTQYLNPNPSSEKTSLVGILILFFIFLISIFLIVGWKPKRKAILA